MNSFINILAKKSIHQFVRNFLSLEQNDSIRWFLVDAA